MLHHAAGALARRGTEVFEKEMPLWGIALLAITAALFFTLDAMIEYTFGRIVPALQMVESPEAATFQPIPKSDPDAKSAPIEPELLVKKPLITSSFRSTVLHLQDRAGRRSRFRGISAFIVYTATLQWVTMILAQLVFVPVLLAPIIASVLCAQLSMTWTHIVISESSPLPWYKRIPSRKLWFQIAGPTALVAVASELTILLPLQLRTEEMMGKVTRLNNDAACRSLLMVFLYLALVVLVLVPAKVTLARVQASLLSPEVDSIVPFDRTFGGRHEHDGEKAVGMLDAWKSFDWNSRMRLLKTYAKVGAMAATLAVLFVVCVAGELILIYGDDVQSLIPVDDNGHINLKF